MLLFVKRILKSHCLYTVPHSLSWVSSEAESLHVNPVQQVYEKLQNNLHIHNLVGCMDFHSHQRLLRTKAEGCFHHSVPFCQLICALSLIADWHSPSPSYTWNVIQTQQPVYLFFIPNGLVNTAYGVYVKSIALKSLVPALWGVL